jgi:hypothetical protein
MLDKLEPLAGDLARIFGGYGQSLLSALGEVSYDLLRCLIFVAIVPLTIWLLAILVQFGKRMFQTHITGVRCGACDNILSEETIRTLDECPICAWPLRYSAQLYRFLHKME